MAKPDELLPPTDLEDRAPKLYQPTGKWYRVVPSDFAKSPLYFGNHGTGRFDHQDGTFGVCYLGDTPEAAFAETLNRLLEDGKFLQLSEAKSKILFEFEFTGEADCIDLSGVGLSTVGATLECFTRTGTSGYADSQEWGRQLMEHPANAAGLHYLGRRAGESCLALFGTPGGSGFGKRRAKTLRIRQTGKISLTESQTFADWLEECGYVLKTSPLSDSLK